MSFMELVAVARPRFGQNLGGDLEVARERNMGGLNKRGCINPEKSLESKTTVQDIFHS